MNPWQRNPSPTSPATSIILGPTPARNTRGGPEGLGPGLKKGGIERVAVELAFERRAGCPRSSRPRWSGWPSTISLMRSGRLRPRHGEPALDVGLHLGAEAEDEPALGQDLKVVAEHGEVHRVAGEGDRRSRSRRRPSPWPPPPSSRSGTGRDWSRPPRPRHSLRVRDDALRARHPQSSSRRHVQFHRSVLQIYDYEDGDYPKAPVPDSHA